MKGEPDGASLGPQRRLNPDHDHDGGGGWLEQHRLHGMLAATRRRFHTAQQRVDEFLAGHQPAIVSWSGGKDSTVVADLATRTQPDIPLVHFDAGLDFPETIDHQNTLAAAKGWDLRRYRCGDALEEMRRTGTWGADHVDETDGSDDDWLWVTRLGPAHMAQQDTGAVANLWGLRASEAKRRHALLARTRGTWQRRSDGMWVCCPIWDWADADIWAYHAVHGIPLNPVYAKLRALGAPAAALRVGYAFDPGGLRHGRAVWLKRGWPDLYQRITETLPFVRGHT